jgi:ethanolamine transporter EutH
MKSIYKNFVLLWILCILVDFGIIKYYAAQLTKSFGSVFSQIFKEIPIISVSENQKVKAVLVYL